MMNYLQTGARRLRPREVGKDARLSGRLCGDARRLTVSVAEWMSGPTRPSSSASTCKTPIFPTRCRGLPPPFLQAGDSIQDQHGLVQTEWRDVYAEAWPVDTQLDRLFQPLKNRALWDRR